MRGDIRTRVSFSLTTLLLLAILVPPLAAQSPPPIVVQAEGFEITPAVRNLPPKLGNLPAELVEMVKFDNVRRWNGLLGPDTAVQNSPPSTAAPAPETSFEGLNNDDNFNAFGGRVLPPDTNGDVGPNHYVQTVNLLFRVYSKTGTPLSPPTKMSALWSSGVCSTNDDGDPIVLYDPLADRWLLSQFAFNDVNFGPFYQCIAISTSPDPAGSYFAYTFQMPSTGAPTLNDYPHFGVWPDAYYMSDNQFQYGAFFAGAGAFAFNRAKMLAGDSTANYIYFNIGAMESDIGGMLPADLDGPTPPPAGTPNYFAYYTAGEFGDPEGDAMRVFEFKANFATPSSSTFTERADSPVAVAAFNPTDPSGRNDIEQPSPAASNQYLDSIQDRILHRLAYRNFGTHESLITTHTVNVGTGTSVATHQSAPRYYELRRNLPSGTFFVKEQASFAPDSHNRWMGSAAMDKDGNIAVGYSISSTSVFPSIRYAARLATDPPNQLTQGETTLIAGTGVQQSTSGRWGDYSAMSVDPSDDCTFWYTQEYYTTNGIVWRTRIGSFKLSTCGTPPIPPTPPTGLTATAVSSSQINLAWTDTSDNETGFKIQRCQGVGCTNFAPHAQVGADVVTYNDTGLSPDTTYGYQVLAFNAAGDSAPSNPAYATTFDVAPAAPSNLAANAVSQTQIDLSWQDNSNNENEFKVQRCQGDGCGDFVQIASVGPNVTNYSDTVLTPNTKYRYRVLASNEIGDSPPSNVAEATTLPNPPSAPTALQATAASSSQIDLTWIDNSGNEDGFKIERCSGTAATCDATPTNFAQIATTGPNAQSYSDTGLPSSTTFSYRVRAFNAGGNSAYSNTDDATTNAPPPPPDGAPSNLTANAVSQTQINLGWTDGSTNEDGFKIERCQGDGCINFAQIATVGANVSSYGDTGLSANTKYRYQVRAFNNGGNSDYSNIAEDTTLANPPAAPSGLTANAVSQTQINLSWTDNSNNEDGFEIDRCQGGGCTDFAQIAMVGANATSYSDTGLTPATTYRYRVRAFNAGGDSPNSNIAEATTPPNPPAAPSNLTANAVSSTQINLAWTDNSNNEDGFKIERCQGGTCTNFAQIAQTGPNVTSYNDTGLQANTTYRYQVRGFNAGGNSGYSNIAQATTQAAPNPPAAPSNLTAAPGGPADPTGSIRLNWQDNSNNEDGFKIERCVGGSCTNFTQITTVGPNVKTYLDTGRSKGRTYRYRVRAFNSAGNSAYSNIASSKPK